MNGKYITWLVVIIWRTLNSAPKAVSINLKQPGQFFCLWKILPTSHFSYMKNCVLIIF